MGGGVTKKERWVMMTGFEGKEEGHMKKRAGGQGDRWTKEIAPRGSGCHKVILSVCCASAQRSVLSM